MQVMNQFNLSSLNFKSRSSINSQQNNTDINLKQTNPLKLNNKADQIAFSKKWILSDAEKALEPDKLARVALNKMETTRLPDILDGIFEQAGNEKLFATISQMRRLSNEPSMASASLVFGISNYIVKRSRVLEHYIDKPEQFINDFNIDGENVELGLKKIAKMIIKNKKSPEDKLKFIVDVASSKKNIFSDNFMSELCLEFKKKSSK